jgi:hypothetical protein
MLLLLGLAGLFADFRRTNPLTQQENLCSQQLLGVLWFFQS